MCEEFDEQEVHLIECIQKDFKKLAIKYMSVDPLLTIFTMQIEMGKIMKQGNISKENALYIINAAMGVNYE